MKNMQYAGQRRFGILSDNEMNWMLWFKADDENVFRANFSLNMNVFPKKLAKDSWKHTLQIFIMRRNDLDKWIMRMFFVHACMRFEFIFGAYDIHLIVAEAISSNMRLELSEY